MATENLNASPVEYTMDDFSSLFTDEAIAAEEKGQIDNYLAEQEQRIQAKRADKSKDFNWINEDAELFDGDLEDSQVDDLGNPNEPSEVEEDGTTDNPLEYFSGLPDDVEIAPGFTKAAISEIIKNKEEYDSRYQFMNEQFEAFDNGTEYIQSILGRNLTETNKTIQAIENALNHPSTDAVRKGQLYNDLQLQKARLNQIESDWQQAEQVRKNQEAYLSDQRYHATVAQMKQQYGRGWDGDAFLNTAINEYGIPVPMLEKYLCPQLAVALQKAMEYDKLKANTKQAVSETVKAPRSTSSTKPHQQRNDTAQSVGRQNAIAKVKDTGDWAGLFDYLED